MSRECGHLDAPELLKASGAAFSVALTWINAAGRTGVDLNPTAGGSAPTDEIAHHVWQTKYRDRENGHLRDETIKDTWRRVARAIAAVELRDRECWEDKFLEILKGYKFLPGGRILAGAGTGRRVTLFNCLADLI